LFFRNGGTLKFVRIEDGTADYADYAALVGATPSITIKGKYKGTNGNNIAITITANETNAANRDIQITDGRTVELYTNGGVGLANNTAIVAAVNASSNLVTATLESGQGSTVLDAITKTYLTGGADGETSLTVAHYSAALNDVLLMEDFNFLLTPGVATDATHTTLAGILDTRDASEKKYSRYLAGIAVDETIATAVARTVSTKRCSIVAPNVEYTHRIDGTSSIYDGSYLACAYAGKLCASSIQLGGTHKTVSVEDVSILVSSGKKYYTKAEQEALLQGGILPITNIGGSIQAVRAITRVGDSTSVFFDEVVVDIVDFVRGAVETYLDSTIGLPNTEQRRDAWASRVDAILLNAQREEIIQEYQPTILVEGDSPDTYVATVSIKPSYNVNFIQLTININ